MLALPVQGTTTNPPQTNPTQGPLAGSTRDSVTPLFGPSTSPSISPPSLLATSLVAVGLIVLAVLVLIVRRSQPGTKSRTPRGTPRAQAHEHAELQQLAGEIASQLDARADRLERLIEQADDRLEQLRQAQAAPGPTTPARRAERPGQAQEPMSESTAAIFTLADEGLTPVQIAQRLRTHVGKVELILALRGQATPQPHRP